jgi:magnesium transporter
MNMTRTLTMELEQFEKQVHSKLEANDLDGLRVLLASEFPADIADLVERLSDEERVKLFQALSLEQAAEVLHEMGQHASQELMTDLPSEHVGDLLDHLPMDDVAEIVSEPS